MTTQFIFKIEPKLKKAAMKKAKEQGTTFSSVLNFAATAFVAGETRVGLLQKEISSFRKDLVTGENFSPEFTNAKDAIAYLKTQTKHARKVS
jgi:hypothetical protein